MKMSGPRAELSRAGRDVLIDPAILDEFVEYAIKEYRLSLETRDAAAIPQHLPRAWAIFVGSESADEVRVCRLGFGTNVRETDSHVLDEFRDVIVPCFGAPYANKGRGFWCSSADLLRISREAEADGLEIVGSVHSHPDWHRIGPEHERKQILSQFPTPMDEYLFRQTGWPVNVICYVESRHGSVYHTYGAWAPPPLNEPEARVTPLTIKHGLVALAQVGQV
jgi:hypothetical protein